MTSDPWRYRCVECGSVSISPRNTAGKTTFNGVPAAAKWYCNECGNQSNHRKDMKTGKVIA